MIYLMVLDVLHAVTCIAEILSIYSETVIAGNESEKLPRERKLSNVKNWQKQQLTSRWDTITRRARRPPAARRAACTGAGQRPALVPSRALSELLSGRERLKLSGPLKSLKRKVKGEQEKASAGRQHPVTLWRVSLFLKNGNESGGDARAVRLGGREGASRPPLQQAGEALACRRRRLGLPQPLAQGHTTVSAGLLGSRDMKTGPQPVTYNLRANVLFLAWRTPLSPAGTTLSPLSSETYFPRPTSVITSLQKQNKTKKVLFFLILEISRI